MKLLLPTQSHCIRSKPCSSVVPHLAPRFSFFYISRISKSKGVGYSFKGLGIDVSEGGVDLLYGTVPPAVAQLPALPANHAPRRAILRKMVELPAVVARLWLPWPVPALTAFQPGLDAVLRDMPVRTWAGIR